MTPTAIGYALVSWLVGFIIGALPGLTATMGVALMTTLTIKLPSSDALLILVCTYVGAIYGGSRSAILLNIPGTPASAASCLDGHALAKQGLAGRAMGIATSGSVLGTWIGMLALAFFTPVLGEMALKFGAYEFFWLAVFGVVISGNLTGNDPLKGWMAGFLGLFIAGIGQDGDLRLRPLHLRHPRSVRRHLAGAGAGRRIRLRRGAHRDEGQPREVIINTFDTVIPKLRDVTQILAHRDPLRADRHRHRHRAGRRRGRRRLELLCGGQRASKEKEKFGKGSIEGLMAAETGDNACVPGAVIPVLALAVPGSAPAAVLLAAMLIHGVKPGPLIMMENPKFVYDVVAMMFIASIGILIYGLTLTRLLIRILQFPQTLIMPVMFVLCVVGSYAIAQRMFDVYVMLAFGVIGFILRQLNFPMAPLVLGIVLGDLLEKNLRRGLVLSDGDLMPFFTRPISFVMFALVAATILIEHPGVQRMTAHAWARRDRLVPARQVAADG